MPGHWGLTRSGNGRGNSDAARPTSKAEPWVTQVSRLPSDHLDKFILNHERVTENEQRAGVTQTQKDLTIKCFQRHPQNTASPRRSPFPLFRRARATPASPRAAAAKRRAPRPSAPAARPAYSTYRASAPRLPGRRAARSGPRPTAAARGHSCPSRWEQGRDGNVDGQTARGGPSASRAQPDGSSDSTRKYRKRKTAGSGYVTAVPPPSRPVPAPAPAARPFRLPRPPPSSLRGLLSDVAGGSRERCPKGLRCRPAALGPVGAGTARGAGRRRRGLLSGPRRPCTALQFWVCVKVTP